MIFKPPKPDKAMTDEAEFNTAPVLSEEMIRRDNFFHSCWMEFKRRRPELWNELTDCELYIAGLSTTKEESDDNDEEQDTIL